LSTPIKDGLQPNTQSGWIKCPWTLVAILWTDAYDSENGWIELDSYKAKEMLVVSVGYICPDCLDGYISITGSFFPDEEEKLKTVGMLTHIPVGMVKQIKIIDQPTFQKKERENEKIYSS